MGVSVDQTDITIFSNDIGGDSYTVGLVDGQPVYGINGVEQTGASVNMFLAAAAGALGGTVTRNGTINPNALEHFGGGQNPGVSRNGDTDTVTIGGSGVSGSFRADFDDPVAAEAFEAFADNLLGSDPKLTALFDHGYDTNGGANRVQIHRNDEIVDLNKDLPGSDVRVADSFIFKVSGADVSGAFTTDDYDVFIDRMADLFDGTKTNEGTLTGAFNQTQAKLAGDDLSQVNLGSVDVGGKIVYTFDDQADAQKFLTFFEDIVDLL